LGYVNGKENARPERATYNRGLIYGNNYTALSGRPVGWIDINPERCSGLMNFALSGRGHSLDFFLLRFFVSRQKNEERFGRFVFLYQDKKMK